MTNQPNANERAIQYAGQLAGIAADGLMESLFTPQVRKSSPAERIADYLERTDYGYGLGLHLAIAAGVTALFGVWWLATPMAILAFVLCWCFG